MLEIIITVFLGIIIGIITGLIPGIHPNAVIPLSIPLISIYPPYYVAIFLLTTGVTNSFVTFIPSILLGAPEEDGALAVLPGHRLLLQGRGYEAIYLSVIGGVGACILSLATLPIFAIIIPTIYTIFRPHTHWLLIFVVSYMIFRESNTSSYRKAFHAFIVFILAGILGIISLNHMDSIALFPLLTGLFALPLLRQSYKTKTTIPESQTSEISKLPLRSLLSSISIGSLAGILAGLLPGIGSAQAAVLAQEVSNITPHQQGAIENTKDNTKSFLISLGGINTADIIYSIFAILLIGNPRSGIAVAISELIELSIWDAVIFSVIILFASLLSAFITLKLAKLFIRKIQTINYTLLSKLTFYFLWLLILAFSGISGLIIAFFAMLIGSLPQKLGVRRTHLMGSLILITILFFMGI
jgi:putative membrane protein